MIKFVEDLPPKRLGPRSRWDSVRAELRTRPGQWAEVLDAPADEAGRKAVRATNATLRGGDFEVAQRKVGDRLIAYARYFPQPRDL